MELSGLEALIATSSTPELAAELMSGYGELKGRYLVGDYRPGSIEAGRFAEAAFRILQFAATGRYTAVGKTLPKVPSLLQTLESADARTVHESIRIHIPRALATVYNVRNRRDVGHIAADVDANRMDAELLEAVCSWVLAEFVRLFHQCSPEEASAYVEALVVRRAPLVQVFGDEPFVLNTSLTVKEELLLLLYHCGGGGVTLEELDHSTPGAISRKVISARLSELENKDRYARRRDGRIYLTETGARCVEAFVRPE